MSFLPLIVDGVSCIRTPHFRPRDRWHEYGTPFILHPNRQPVTDDMIEHLYPSAAIIFFGGEVAFMHPNPVFDSDYFMLLPRDPDKFVLPESAIEPWKRAVEMREIQRDINALNAEYEQTGDAQVVRQVAVLMEKQKQIQFS